MVAMPQLGISLDPKFNSVNPNALARHRAALLQKAQQGFPIVEVAVGGLLGFGLAMAAFWFGTH
jgi:hypothetical protein